MLFRFGEARRSAVGSEVPAGWRRPRLAVGTRAACVIILLGWTSAGCVGGDGPAIFAGHDNASALLVQWTDDGNGGLTGSVQIADKSASDSGAAVKQTTLTFTGKLDANQVSLVVKEELGATKTWNGSLDGDELRVNVPEGTSVDSMILARASAETYNEDVALLEAEVLRARAEVASAAAEADNRDADQDAEAATQKSFADAVSDLSAGNETVLALILDPPELKALPKDLGAARSNLAKVKVNAGEAALRSRGFVACEFASQAQAASDDVEGDASFLEDDVRAVTEAADDLADARAELSAAYLRLQGLSESSGQSSKSASAAVNTLIDKAKGKALAWRSAANQAQKAMNSISSEANSLAQNAHNASC